MTRAMALAPALLGLAALGAGCGPEPAPPVSGEALFRTHCVACHGAEGRGDGPLAEELRRRPADLTALARGGDGFDAEAVKRSIDGRRVVPSHGPRDMPVWGVVFGVRHVGEPFYFQRSGQELDALVAYLAALQGE